jgi:hypothetical protein
MAKTQALQKTSTPEQDLAETCRKLEGLCVQRKRTELKQGVRQLLKEHPDTPRLLNRALDWYIRSGLSKDALHLIYADPKMKAGLKSPFELGTSKGLYFMVLLASHSGWPWVLKWLNRTPSLNSSRDQVLFGNILSRVGNPKSAYLHIAKSAPTGLEKKRILSGKPEEQKESERRQDILTSLSHLCWKLEDHKKGLQHARDWLAILPADDLYGRYHAQTMVHYFEGQLGDPAVALEGFQKALKSAPNCRETAPRIYRISLLWRARLEAKAGRKSGAIATFNEATEITRNEIPTYSPIQMTEILCEKLRLDIATTDEIQTLRNYPILPAWEKELVALRTPVITEVKPVDHSTLAPTTWWISPASDEYFHEGCLNAGIPLEISLLSLLAQAGKFGIHRNLAMALLWPEQWMLLPQLDERLTKLTKRLRTEHKVEIIANQDCLFLGDQEGKRIIVDIDRKSPTFLDTLPQGAQETFSWQQLADHYSMKPTPARDLIARWLEQGLITKLGAGPATRYKRT